MVNHSQSAAVAATLADFREQLTELELSDGVRRALCSDCGRPYPVRGRKTPGYCATCGAARLLDTCDSLKYRQGPIYEKAVLGQLRHWTAEAERLGLQPGGR